MADQFTGKNLSVVVGSVTIPCPQSFEINGAHEFVTYYCTASTAEQKIYEGTDWTASCTFFPEDNDQADLAALNSETAVACVVQPDGNTADKIELAFNAYPSISLNTQRGSVASATVNLRVTGDVTIQGVGV